MSKWGELPSDRSQLDCFVQSWYGGYLDEMLDTSEYYNWVRGKKYDRGLEDRI